MKLALILFGISLEINRYWQYGALYSVDYKNSYDNYQRYIFDYFKGKGYSIDVYISTNKLNSDDDVAEIIDKYKPVKYRIADDCKDYIISRNKKLESAIDLCIEGGGEYDLVLITRFDLLFQKDFADSNIHLDKINIVSVLERPNLICDNFYLFPHKYLKDFQKVIRKCANINHRNIKNDFEKIAPINYILNENCDISELSFYKIAKTSYI
ncbi:MAG: hypothetical protein ACOVNU_05150 [Candidatus Kapaibacteriota bacterium]